MSDSQYIGRVDTLENVGRFSVVIEQSRSCKNIENIKKQLKNMQMQAFFYKHRGAKHIWVIFFAKR